MASPFSPKIIELRRLLGEQRQARVNGQDSLWQCGDPQVDELQIPKAALTEIVADPASVGGGALFLHRFLQLTLPRQRVVLIDGKNSFDPDDFSQPLLDRLLWLRCPDAALAMKSCDLILRDGNIPLAILLFLLNPSQELKKIPSQAWHRLHLLTEKSAVTFLVFTPFPQIGSARLRVTLSGSFSLADLDADQPVLLRHLRLETTRRRLSLGNIPEDTSYELRSASCA